MSQEKPSDTSESEVASVGSGIRWLAGAALPTVSLGGGYYAWSNYGPSQSSASNTQSNMQTAQAPLPSGPLPAQSGESVASPKESGSASRAPTQTAAATPAHRRASARAATPVPEE